MTLEHGILPEDHAILNNVMFKTVGPAQRSLASQLPGKVRIGDSTRDSRPNTSIWSMSDWTGGIGVERLQGETSTDRLWRTNMNPTFVGHLTLGPKVDAIPKPAGASAMLGIEELSGNLYGVFRVGGQNRVHRYDGASWSNPALHTFIGTFNSVNHVELEGEDYLVITHSLGVDYSNDGTDWTEAGRVT